MYLILSNGHSATRWITNILSKDQFSKCFHGDSLLLLNPKIKDIVSYHKFLIEYNSKKNLIVGSIHLPFNLNKNSISELKKLNIEIFYLMRNPIDKINSMMQFYLEKFATDGFFVKKKNTIYKDNKSSKFYVETIFKDYKNQINTNFKNYQRSKNIYFSGYAYDSLKFKINKKLFNTDLNEAFIKNRNNREYLSKVIIHLFLFTCSSCLRFDEQLVNFNRNKVILFEEITQNKENFLNFAKLLNNKFCEENLNLEDFSYKIGKNVRNYSGISLWPDVFKDYFFKCIKEKKLYNFYKEMNYITS